MLVLTRKVGEAITIDGNIKIHIQKVQGKQVRVGISAPKERKIQRTELLIQTKKPQLSTVNLPKSLGL